MVPSMASLQDTAYISGDKKKLAPLTKVLSSLHQSGLLQATSNMIEAVSLLERSRSKLAPALKQQKAVMMSNRQRARVAVCVEWMGLRAAEFKPKTVEEMASWVDDMTGRLKKKGIGQNMPIQM
eukprot:12400830-Karenia_brevis.AAC.1